MPVYDADAHVEECPQTFSDEYLDPAFRPRRPQVIAYGDRPHWLIDYQIFPRFSGPGPQSLGTPTSLRDVPSIYTRQKPESIESLELRDPAARIRNMEAEGIDVQVLYPTLFLAYQLTPDPAYAAALCASYNRWMVDRTTGYEDRLKWVAPINLEDVPRAVQEVRHVKDLGGVGVMIGGTAGDRLLSDPLLLPFFEECAAQDLPIAVHVVWSCPSINRLFDELYYSTVIAFPFPVLIGFVTILGSGLLDRFPTLRVGFFEAGSQWIHFVTDRMDHRFGFVHRMQAEGLPTSVPGAKQRAIEYLRRGNVYFSFEVEDRLLPQAVELAGGTQFLFASDMPHADRERFAARDLKERTDLYPADVERMLCENVKRFYGI